MSDMQFFVSVAVMPVTTIIIVLIGVLLNNSNMNNRINDVMARISDLRAEMTRRLDSVETKIDLLTGKVIELDNRLTRVEAHLGLK